MEEFDFNVQVRKLASCFPTKMQDEKLAFIYNRFRNVDAIKFEKTIDKLIETCKHMPSISDMLEIYHSLYPVSTNAGIHRGECKSCDTFGAVLVRKENVLYAYQCGVCRAGWLNFGALPKAL